MGNTIDITTGRMVFDKTPKTVADLQDLADYVRKYVGATAPNESGLGAISPRWEGLIAETQDTKTLWLCTDSAGNGTWVPFGGKPIPITVTPQNSIDWTSMRVRKIGNRVFIDGRVASSTDIGQSVIGGSLPTGARPAVDQVKAAVSLTGGFAPALTFVSIPISGVVTLNYLAAPANCRYIHFDLSYEVA